MSGLPVRIGLTGPIGCGKSTIATMLAERGAVVVDADELARMASQPGGAAHRAIVARFGQGIVRPDGSLDRRALGGIVFADPDALHDLEAIVHPAVRPAILAALDEASRAGAGIVVLEAIRLVEAGYPDVLDEVWLVTCAPDDQLRRLVGRGLDAGAAGQRIAAQAGLVERVRPVATRVIETTGPLSTTADRVDEAVDAALEANRVRRRS